MAGFLDRLQTFLFGAAIGRASSDAVTPVLEPVRQHAWFKNQNKVLDPGTAAELVAKRFILESEGQFDAERSGIADNRFGALIRLAQTYPGLGDLDKLSNRELLDSDRVKEVLGRLGYPDTFTDAIIALFQDLLSVAEVGAAVQQGHLPNEGILPNVDPSVPAVGGQVTADPPDGGPPSHVPLTQIDIDPIKEAAHQGYDLKRLEVIANLAGLPPGPELLLNLWNRELIDEESVDAGIREGHMKTKWAQAFKRLRWNVLGAAEYANAYVREWITHEEMYKGGKLTGHTKEQMDLLFKNRGRPLAPVQAFTAWARDAPHPIIPGEPDRPGTFDYTDFEQALRRSDIQTWYAPVLWHNRFAYPTLFQLGRLAQAGALTEARVRVILKYERYEQQDIDALVAFWYGGGGTGTSSDVKKAQTQLWTATHKSYIARESGDGEAHTRLTELGISPADQDAILALWQEERSLVHAQLSPSDIRKALQEGITNPDTGQPWARQQALDALQARGFDLSDANTYLDTPYKG